VILRAGLTGGIASGKSTILQNFARLGCLTVDADSIVARLYEPGQSGHEAIVRTYGTAVLRPDGTIDRRKLADAAFRTSADAQKLNALIHPLVVAEEARLVRIEEERLRGEDAIYMVEATLLLEAGGRQRYEKIVVVDVPPEVQLARGVGRGMPEEEVRRRMANQMPREERLRYADYVIDNSGDRQAGQRETRRVYEALRRDLEAARENEKAPRV
jgi:dephospho-CoA kinase